MTVKEGIQYVGINTVEIKGDETTMLFNFKQLNETMFNYGLRNRENMTFILNDDLVEGVKIKMKFGNLKLYITVRDNMFGELINKSYTYE